VSINPIDREQLREQFRTATPFPNVCIDDFLDEDFAGEIARSFPSFHEAQGVGKTFAGVNEKNKVQVRDPAQFPPSIKKLNDMLADPAFLEMLSYATGIADLRADEKLVGGGIHETTRSGHLDVHVDFNVLKDRQWHRRLNIIIFFNKAWQDEWGGRLELWDANVKQCVHSFQPLFNRCVIFQTSEISYHGVTGVMCPDGVSRKSFAAYYYTEEAPQGWDGRTHTTLFKARPDEKMKGRLLMPAERMRHALTRKMRALKQKFT
jgi:Rps23 Pro-64 3,4-dihydroxylase Tpa1-like proline 4-hydroxylase